MNILPLLISGIFLPLSCLTACETVAPGTGTTVSIPAAGNSWVISDISLNDRMIGNNGIGSWSEESAVIRTWFRTEKEGKLTVSLRTRTVSGTSMIELKLAGQVKTVKIRSGEFETVIAGTFDIKAPGYQYVDIRGLEKSGSTYCEISDFIISGPAAEGRVWFVKDDFYFGRRGPSVHLRFDIPQSEGNVEWFYSEITVPEGNDVIGSYFMANGFADGYFGIQVNSETERRILFSVWSPYKTDNPGEIPEEYRIILLGKGEGVITGEFGNEGSGGQSYRVFPWKAGNTYRFLLRGHPSINNSTDYTAWFYAPETGKWELIAGFRRPKTNNYLRNLYSFLENFMPETGMLPRKGYFSNQWVKTTEGKWIELTSAKFTADATARKEARLDYSGGTEDGKFFLRNCGFFNEMTTMDGTFSRQPSGTQPSATVRETW
ncbi:MAG: DUF3472 domain-containing protein [Bacteroidales bacterium]|jgi:hypothetical protein|nr:DUF3472 domain-containing protein [Bacteroidales bacterium]MCU0408300.1 DUF3472 domain-containing protein [Bacteroidales bacterium]